MAALDPTPSGTSQTIDLARGEQVVINGAVVSATAPCAIEVGAGAYILAGQGLRKARSTLQNPAEELYFSLLDADTHPGRFQSERIRLFQLLSEILAQNPDEGQQADCSFCAVALMQGDAGEAVRIAARLASYGLDRTPPKAAKPHEPSRLRSTELGNTRCNSGW